MGARRKSAKRPRPSRAARSSRGNGARAPRGAKVPRHLRALGGVDPRLLAAGVPYPCDDPRVGTVVHGGRSTPGGRVVACAARGADRRGHDLYVGGAALSPRQIAAARRYAEGEARRAERRASRAATAPAPRGRRRAPAKEIPPFVYDPNGPLPSAAFGPGGVEPRRPLGYGAGAVEPLRPSGDGTGGRAVLVAGKSLVIELHGTTPERAEGMRGVAQSAIAAADTEGSGWFDVGPLRRDASTGVSRFSVSCRVRGGCFGAPFVRAVTRQVIAALADQAQRSGVAFVDEAGSNIGAMLEEGARRTASPGGSDAPGPSAPMPETIHETIPQAMQRVVGEFSRLGGWRIEAFHQGTRKWLQQPKVVSYGGDGDRFRIRVFRFWKNGVVTLSAVPRARDAKSIDNVRVVEDVRRVTAADLLRFTAGLFASDVASPFGPGTPDPPYVPTFGPGGAEPRRPLGYGAGAPEPRRQRAAPAGTEDGAAYLPSGTAPTFADRVETFAQFVRDDLSSLPPGTRSAPRGAWRVEVKPSREFWYVRLDGPSSETLVYEVNVRNGEITYARRSGGKNFHVPVVGVTGPERNAPRYVPAGETFQRTITLDDYTHFRWGAAWPYPMQPVYVGPRAAPALRKSPLGGRTPETRKAPSDKPSGLRTAPPLTGTWVPRALARTAPGSGYDEWKDITDLAKTVRADIRAAQDNGALPKGLEVSVTTERYSMGRSLNVTVTSVDVPVMNPRLVSDREDVPREWDEALGRWVPYSRFNNAGRTILANLDAIVRRYHVDKSDMSTDYYNVNFSWSGAGFASWVEHQQQQSLFPADAPERPEVFVDYYLTHALGEALGRMKVKLRWDVAPWAFTNGRQNFIAVAPSKNLPPVNLPVPQLAGAPANEYQAGDLNEAFELALSLAKSPRKNPRPNPRRSAGGARSRRSRR